MRKLFAYAAKNTPALQSEVSTRVYGSSSLGRGSVPPNPKKPFVVFREIDRLEADVAKDTSPDVCRRVFQVYVHDEKGGYVRIDRILDVLRETVRGLRDQVSSTGARCIDAMWNSTSADTEDPTYDSNMKFATFTLVSSK